MVVMFDKLAEDFARYIRPAKKFKPGVPPSADTAIQNGDVAITIAGKFCRPLQSETIVVIAQHNARRATRNERGKMQFQAAQGQRNCQQEVAAGKNAFL